MTPTSVAPYTAPVPNRIRTSVRIAGEPSEPRRGRRCSGARRQRLDVGWAANANVPASITSPLTASAAPVDQNAPSASASGGPNTNVSSSTVDSSAYSAGSAPASRDDRRQQGPDARLERRRRKAGRRRERDQKDGGGAVWQQARSLTSATAVTAALQISTAVCPKRSTNRPSAGAESAPAIAYAPLTTPATANDPVWCWALTSSAMLNIASGRRAMIEVASNARAPGDERSGRLSVVVVMAQQSRSQAAQ